MVTPTSANPPTVNYIFPAGGQRGATVPVRVGGLFLHDRCEFDLTAPGVKASPQLIRDKRLWFEGPILPLPESQQQEDYPADMRGEVKLAPGAELGAHRVRVFTSQGGASGPVFVVGDLPEVVEQEIDGEAIPEAVKLPVTANGRIFPREDVDLWEFDAEAGKTVTAYAHCATINSPVVPQLTILDARGTTIAEQMLHPCPGTDASVRFTPKTTGKYRVRITDARTLGGPAYVYRLTITTSNVPTFHFPLKVPADGLKDITDASKPVAVPCALNGQIESRGKVGEWKVELKKGSQYTLDLQARQFESPLCGVVRVTDPTGKEIGKVEAGESADPGRLAFTATVDGIHLVQVTERFRGRFGANFVYRLRVVEGPLPTVSAPPGLKVATDVFTVNRNNSVRVKVDRTGSFQGPIVITAENLPKGVTAAPVVIPAKNPGAELVLTASAEAVIGSHPLRITGTGIAGLYDRVSLGMAVCPANGSVPGSTDLRLAVAFPTPFKIVDQYVMTSAPRGETYFRKYTIDRGTFLGTITIQLADKQARHLQGVTGPVLTLKPGESEFAYPAFLPPWMELGRTCRVCIMATATVRDPVDGREHTVSFSSVEQNQQMIVVVAPGRLDVTVDRSSVLAEPGREVRLTVKVSRSKSLTGAARIEAVFPEHWKGVTVGPLVIPADADSGELMLKFAPESGPFNAPLVIRATVQTKETPVTAETHVEVVK